MDASQRFKGKRVTVMGLGLLGRGVGDAAYLASCGAELIVTDLKSKEGLQTSLEKLAGYTNITYVLGEHRLEDFRDRDFVLKAAGVPLDSPYIEEAKKNGVPVYMSASLFAEVAGIPMIGVTGTRGKSTVTHMIHAILKQAQKPVLLGGNVRGVSTLALLSEATPEHSALFELDSWQLQGFGDAHISPQIAVFTTFFPDHLNYYHNDLARYLNDKAQIFLHQNEQDALVLGSQCAEVVQSTYGSAIKAHTIVADASAVPEEWELRVIGEHNRYNAGIALSVARALGIDDGVSRIALEMFTSVEGRLELVRTLNGVDIYNDTNSTTPDATLVALDAIQKEGKNPILIMGGADKQLDMSPLVARLPHLKKVVLLQGTGTEQIRKMFGAELAVHDNLSSALAAALEGATSEDAVLFSPAFASFGMFKNEYDRGDQFIALVNSL